MLAVLNTIAAQQLKITQEKAKKVVQLLNYAATHPKAITRYHTSGITLHMYIDASFLSAPGEKRRAGGYHYLSEPSSEPKNPPHKPQELNGTIQVECTTMKNVLASAMQA